MNINKQRAEIAVTALILALAGYLQYVAYHSKVRIKVQGMQSMTFPKIILYIIMGLCLIVLVRGILNYRKLKKAQDQEIHQENKGNRDIRVPMTVALIVVYAMLWNVLGFILSSVLFVCSESLLLDRSKPWWHAAVIAVAYVAIVYLIFGVGFGVNFPEPILDALLG